MKKLLTILLAMLLLSTAAVAFAFEYAAPETLEIDGIEVHKVWVDTIPVYYTLPEGYQDGDEVKMCLFLSGLSGNKESLVTTYSNYITARGYMGGFCDQF